MPKVNLTKDVARSVSLLATSSYTFEVFDPFTTVNWTATSTEPTSGWATAQSGPFEVPVGKGGYLWFRSDIDTSVMYRASNPGLDAVLAQPIVPRAISGALRSLRSVMQSATTYVVTGDSTRQNPYNNMSTYYDTLLTKAGITLEYDARSGMTTSTWVANTYPSGTTASSQSHCIGLIPGTGAGTVWEFSLGINDESGQPNAAGLFAEWKAAIDPVLAAKPDVSLVLVQPVAVADSARNDKLNEAYSLLQAEYGVHLVELYQPMRDVYDAGSGNLFYKDSTHPTDFGSVRAVNIILSDILADSQLGTVTLDTSHYRGYVARRVITGSYWNSGGNISTNAAWARFDTIDVSALGEGTEFEIYHNGARDDIRWLPSVGEAQVHSQSTPDTGALPLYTYLRPAAAAGAGVLAVNVDDASAPAMGDEYVRVTTPGYKGPLDMTQTEINAGVGLRLTEE